MVLAGGIACSRPPEGARRFNGTWEAPGAELRMWALDERRLQVAFRGEYRYESVAGPMVNVGSGSGEAAIENGTATFRPDGSEPGCAISMTLAEERLDVTQAGACGFGLNVTAAGTYVRASGDRPSFGSPEPAER